MWLDGNPVWVETLPHKVGPNKDIRDLSGEIVNNLVESFSLFLYFFMSNICVGKIC